MCRNELCIVALSLAPEAPVTMAFFSRDIIFRLSPVLPDASLVAGVLLCRKRMGLRRTEDEGALCTVDILRTSVGGFADVAFTADLARGFLSACNSASALDFVWDVFPVLTGRA